MHAHAETPEPVTPEVVRVLVENHARFLDFLTRRVESRDAAEELLQEAFVRGIRRAESIRDGESATAWFYRLLRNALVDHYRRRDAEARGLARVALEPAPEVPALDEALMSTVCACVTGLVDTLKPEHAAVIRAVDLEGATVSSFAEAQGITANNASVRRHRALAALRRQLERCCGACATHGCLECTCSHAPAGDARGASGCGSTAGQRTRDM